jgi:hypothetical protein
MDDTASPFQPFPLPALPMPAASAGEPAEPKQRRKRRTRAEMEAARLRQGATAGKSARKGKKGGRKPAVRAHDRHATEPQPLVERAPVQRGNQVNWELFGKIVKALQEDPYSSARAIVVALGKLFP